MASANPDEVDDTVKVWLYTAEGDIKACYVTSELFTFIRIIFIHLYNLPRLEGLTGVLCIFVTIGESFKPGQTDLFFTL